jgi:hypothetical protein
MDVAPSGRSDVEDGDRFAVEGAAADRPVERVLKRSRNAERVFGDREQQSPSVRADLAEVPDRFGREWLEVRIEVRKRSRRDVDDDRQTVPCRRVSGGTESGGVDRAAPEATGDSQNHLLPFRSSFLPG